MQIRNAAFWFSITLWSVPQPLLAAPPLAAPADSTKLSPSEDEKRALAKQITAIVGPPLQMQLFETDRGAPAPDSVGYAAFLTADPRNKDRIANDPHFVEREVLRGTLLRQKLSPLNEARYAKFDSTLENLYIEKFSIRELTSILNFFKTSAGQKYSAFHNYADLHIFDFIAPDITADTTAELAIVNSVEQQVRAKFPLPVEATNSRPLK